MEENVFPDVEHLLSSYIICQLYADEKTTLEESEIVVVPTSDGGTRKKELTNIGDKWSTLETITYAKTTLPYYVLYSWKDGLLTNPRGKTNNVEEFAGWLQCGLDAFNQ